MRTQAAVPGGPVSQDRGGEMFSPSQVYCAGISPPSSKAGLSRRTFVETLMTTSLHFAHDRAQREGGACERRNPGPPLGGTPDRPYPTPLARRARTGPGLQGRRRWTRVRIPTGSPAGSSRSAKSSVRAWILRRRRARSRGGEPHAQPNGRDHRVRSGLQQLVADGLEDRCGVVRVRREPDLPGLAGGPIRPLQRPALPGSNRLRPEEPVAGQGPDVVEDGARVLVQPIGQLLVGVRLVQGQAQDPQPQGMGEGPHLGGRRVALGRRGRPLTGGHFQIGWVSSIGW